LYRAEPFIEAAPNGRLAKKIHSANPSAMEGNKENRKAHVYMITNYGGNVLYIGSTEDLKSRLDQHKKRLIPGFTQKYNVYKLVYFEEHPDIECAEKREQYLKGKNRAKKNAVTDAKDVWHRPRHVVGREPRIVLERGSGENCYSAEGVEQALS